ncbi:hypothetical protein ACFVUS_26950 [Nocardia sp. NPDC058058]|uniref:hypothetical protein n=1 Tax=Nocardia sp. NPDC058058 TaxID=3346317 RepID=UPI0036DF1CCB
MLSTPTVGQFRKASSSSPQQACVMVYRDDHRTLIWDDKLAATVDTPHVPPGQCLSFDHEQFEVIQEAIRAGEPVERFLVITRRFDGLYEFSADADCADSAGATRLYFDHREFTAFVRAVAGGEFARALFAAVGTP